jgi:hypothetical protein
MPIIEELSVQRRAKVHSAFNTAVCVTAYRLLQ